MKTDIIIFCLAAVSVILSVSSLLCMLISPESGPTYPLILSGSGFISAIAGNIIYDKMGL